MVFDQLNKECRFPRNVNHDNNVKTNNSSINTIHWSILPYKGEKGQKIIKSVNNYVKRLLLESHAAQHIPKSRKLHSSCNTKDKTKLVHKSDLTYLVKCPENTYSEKYLGETAGSLKKGTGHAGKDSKSHMFKHTSYSGHLSVSRHDFRIVQKGYSKEKVKRKIWEAILFRKHQLSLHIHGNVAPFELFNWYHLQ